MKQIIVVCAVFGMSGCSTVPDAVGHAWDTAFPNPRTYGYTEYDPCVRCGESWQFLNLDETKELKK